MWMQERIKASEHPAAANERPAGSQHPSMEAEGLRARHTQPADVAALLAEPVEAHLLALELQPAALLAIVPAAAVPGEVALAAVHVLVLGHQGDRRLRGQVGELAVPIPEADGHEEEV